MLNHQTIKRVNRLAANPLVVQALFYDLDEQSGFCLEKALRTFECLCPFCLGLTLTMTESHFIQQFNSNGKETRPQNTKTN